MELKEQYASVKASIEIEGFTISEQVEKLIIKEAKREISFEVFTKQMKQLVKAHE